MPKVTLLKPARKDYTLMRGNTAIKFTGGVPTDVEPAVAISCKKVMEKGRPIFSVEDMPRLISPKREEQNDSPKKGKSTRLASQRKLFDV